MRWEDERYVRVYTRDTAELLALGWEGRALLWEILRKVDRAGLLPLGKTGVRGLAAVTGLPFDLADRALPVLLDDGCVRLADGVLVVPNFIAAQETPQSDKARQREKRARDRDRAIGGEDHTESQNVSAPSQNVTESHEVSRAVTGSHAASRDVTPCCAVPDHAVPSRAQDPAPPPADAGTWQEAKRPRKRPAEKPAKEPTAEDNLREAFVGGIDDAAPGEPFSLPSGKLGGLLGPVMRAHAAGLQGAEAYAWLRRTVTEWRRSTESNYTGGWHPRHLGSWLNGGRQKSLPRVVGLQQPAKPGEHAWKMPKENDWQKYAPHLADEAEEVTS